MLFVGYPRELRDVATDALYWQALAVDAEGHITQEKYGNAIVTTRGYNPHNGRLNTIDARNALNQPVQYNTYGYDLLGNVTLRWDEGSGSASGDSLTYDALNRLTHTDNWTNGVQTVTAVAYDALGNITSKGGVGAYLYGGNPGCAAGNGATRQGHTGHEMLEIGLTHMNGRLYDAELARFVSADPLVQAPL